MGVRPKRIETWAVRDRWLEAWNGCQVRGIRIVMGIWSSKLVMYDTIWWDHEAWSWSRVMRRCGRCVYIVVLVPAQGGRGSQTIGCLPRALGRNINDRVLCHRQILHPGRWDIWDLAPGSPSSPTARLPRRLSASGVMFIRAGCAVGLA